MDIIILLTPNIYYLLKLKMQCFKTFLIIVQDGTYAQIVRRLPIICAIHAHFLCARGALKVLITSVLGEAKGSVDHV